MSRHDDLFQELGRTLDVRPSRDFATGVHARIARRRLLVRSTLSGLAIAASVIIVALVRSPEPPPVVATLPPSTPQVVAAPVVVPPAVAAAAARGVPARQPRRITPVAEPDRLQVVTNQMAVLRAAWAGHRVTAGEMAAIEADPADSGALANCRGARSRRAGRHR